MYLSKNALHLWEKFWTNLFLKFCALHYLIRKDPVADSEVGVGSLIDKNDPKGQDEVNC